MRTVLLICTLTSLVAANALYALYTAGEDSVSIVYACDGRGYLHAFNVKANNEVAGFPVLLEDGMYIGEQMLVVEDVVILATSHALLLKLLFVDRNNGTLIGEWVDEPGPHMERIINSDGVHEDWRTVILSTIYLHTDRDELRRHIRWIDLRTRKLVASYNVPISCAGRLKDEPYCVARRMRYGLSEDDST